MARGNLTIEGELATKAGAAREELDAWVREMVEWHFNPETGCPFWLDRAARLGFDPRKEIRGYGDLDKLGFFEQDWLCGGPIERWIPKAYAGRPVFVFETGGADKPKSRAEIEDFRIDYESFSETLPDEYFPPGSDWLQLSPTGPRRLRLAVEHLAQYRGGICFQLDLDARWVSRLRKMGMSDAAERYRQHVIDQALTLLRAHENIRCLYATPRLLEALCEKVKLRRIGVTGVFCCGTELTPEFHRRAAEELCEGLYFAPAYANTLMGVAPARPRQPGDDWALVYYPPAPRAMIEVVDPACPDRVVGYGEPGRLRLTTLTREFFMPRLLEGDEAEREPPCDVYPWDGIGNVRPLSRPPAPAAGA